MNYSILIQGYITEMIRVGEYQGIVTNTNTIDFNNYSVIDYWHICAAEFRQKYSTVTLIDIIKIKKEFRGMGYGKKLIENITTKSKEHGSEAIILMADLLEHNHIDLVEWYQKIGFRMYIGSGQALPLMIKEI